MDDVSIWEWIGLWMVGETDLDPFAPVQLELFEK